MKETGKNIFVRVHPHTRKQLKIIAAQTGETMIETIARIAQIEMERLQKKQQEERKS